MIRPNNTCKKVQIMKLVAVHVTAFPIAISTVITIAVDDRIYEWWIWRASKEMVLVYWRYYPSSSLEALRNAIKKLMIAADPVKTRTEHLPNEFCR
jgi:hypothetical protein